MSSLQETLAALSTSLPELPAKLQELVTEEKGVDRAAVDLVNNVARKRGEAAEMLTNLQHALSDIKTHAHQDEAQLKAGGDAIDHAADQVASDIDTQGHAIEERARTADTAMDALAQALVEAGHEAQQGEHDLQHGVDRLGQVLVDGQRELSHAADTVVAAMKELDTALDETKSAVTEGADDLVTALHQCLEHTHERLLRTVSSLHALCGHIATVVPQQEEHLLKTVDHVENTVRTALDHDLKERATEAASQIGHALDELAQVLGQAETESRTHKEVLEQHVTELHQVMQPLPSAVVKLKEAVQTAGLSWN